MTTARIVSVKGGGTVDLSVTPLIDYAKLVHCPFHHDPVAVLNVHGDGTWKCTGCGKRGYWLVESREQIALKVES